MKKGRWLRTAILIIALAVFLYSGYQLFLIYSEYNKGDKEYESIIEEVVNEEEPIEENVEETSETGHVTLNIDFDKLRTINSEIVGWIQFTEPQKINYPLVHGPDNDKYLTTTFEGKKNSSGALFVDVYNAGDFSDRNTFIHGHNMKNGSMFGRLRQYKNRDFYKQYPYFYIYTPDGKEVTYQIFAVCIVESNSESYINDYFDDDAFSNYLKNIRKRALYGTEVEVDAKSQIISLSTCTNVTETQRLLVHGVKISERKMGE